MIAKCLIRRFRPLSVIWVRSLSSLFTLTIQDRLMGVELISQSRISMRGNR